MLVVGVIFLLQAIPYTGVFLMIMLASLWSAPLINLAVVVAGVEALTGRLPRWLVLLPVCWFGLYAVAVWREEAGLVEAQAVVAERNAAAVPVVYDPGRHDIVFGDLGDGLFVARHVDRLLLSHRLPEVYYTAGRLRERMSAARVATGPLCETLDARSGGAAVEVRKIHESTARHHNLDSAVQACIVSFAEEPAREILRLGRREERERFRGLSVRMIVTSAENGGEKAEIRGASASVLKWLPIPVLGCALNSGAPSWDCFAGFMRQRMVWFGTKLDEARALEMALDLSRAVSWVPSGARPGSVEEAGNALLLDRLAEADRRFDRRRDDQLEAFLQDPGTYKQKHRLLEQFKAQPEKLAPHAERLIAVLETADAAARDRVDGATERASAVAALVARLPDREIERTGGRLLELLDGPRRRWWNQARPLMRRTALLGQAALPMLTRRLEAHRGPERISWPVADAIIALCRIGAPLALPAGPKLFEIWQRRLNPRPRARASTAKGSETELPLILDRADKNLYLALLRLGLRDQAGLPEPRGKSEWWPKAWQTVAPDSPPEVCEDAR